MNTHFFSALSFVICCLVSTVSMAQTFEVRASTKDYNRLVFPSPYDSVVIPPSANLAEEPIPLAGHRSVLLRPSKGAKTIPVFVQLKTGDSFTVKLIPGTSSDGAVFRYKDAQDMSRGPSEVSRPNDKWISRAILAAYEGKAPGGFSNTDLPPAARLVYDSEKEKELKLAPLAKYRGSQHKISVYQLQSDHLTNIEPRDFYRDGVVAVSLEGDVVSSQHHPRLIVLEADDDRE